jgi:WD40 repeat protein
MLRENPQTYGPHAIRLLREASLSRLAESAGYAHEMRMRAIQVSLEALLPQARDRYFALATELEDIPVPHAVRQTLWNTGELDALDTAMRLVDRSVAGPEGDGGGIRLHDFQLGCIRAHWEDREPLALIHGAVRLSAHVVEKDASQFAAQMVGRLLPHEGFRWFTDRTAAGAPQPWLRPMHPALDLPGTGLIRTPEGYRSWVTGVVVAPDGRWAVSASEDKTLWVWDLDAGLPIAAFTCDAEALCCAFAGPRTIVAGDELGRVHFLALEIGDGE